MKRSTNILGFAFLTLAATLAAIITMRNAPAPSRTASGPKADATGAGDARGAAAVPDRSAVRVRPSGLSRPGRDSFKVSLPEDWLATLPPDQRQAWLERAVAVEHEATAQLEKLSANLDLNSTQRGKLFPALVRATAGYDPAMIVGGATVAADTGLTPAEEIHSLLNEDQQAQVEDNEVERQLWWQDIIGKLEADLTNETGGPAPDTSAPAAPVPADEERVAPEARDDGNLFDLITPP
jgi:hypothetical protein